MNEINKKNEINGINEKIQRWQIKAKIFLNENILSFIIDTNNSYFFAKILATNESEIIFKPFKGNGKDQEIKKYWADIYKFEEYKEVFD